MINTKYEPNHIEITYIKEAKTPFSIEHKNLLEERLEQIENNETTFKSWDLMKKKQYKIEVKKDDFFSIFEKDITLLQNERKETVLDFYKNSNFPSKKDEKWRHTKLKSLLQNKYKIQNSNNFSEFEINDFLIPNLDANVLVFINGNFIEKYSKINNKSSFIIEDMIVAKSKHSEIFDKYFESTEIYKKDVFTATNSAFISNGTFIYLKENTIVDKPIHIINISNSKNENTASQTRNLFIFGNNSQSKIISTYHTMYENFVFDNIVTEIIVAAKSVVNYNIVQDISNKAHHINNINVLQDTSSSFTCNTISLSGKLIRNEIDIDINGEHCETDINGLYLPTDNQHFDNILYLNHSKPNCKSNQLYKGIIDNEASAVFYGKVFVAKDSQKTNANQSNKNVLLTNSATINSKPQLEIYADDVSCSHGSTTGQLDENAMFYLQARGIGKNLAKRLLLKAFVSDVIDKITIKEFKEYVDNLIKNSFQN